MNQDNDMDHVYPCDKEDAVKRLKAGRIVGTTVSMLANQFAARLESEAPDLNVITHDAWAGPGETLWFMFETRAHADKRIAVEGDYA